METTIRLNFTMCLYIRNEFMKEKLFYLFILIWTLFCFYVSFSALGYWAILIYAIFFVSLSLFIYHFSRIKKRILKFKIFKNQNFIYIITVILFISGLFAPDLFLSLIMAFMNATCITFAIVINLS